MARTPAFSIRVVSLLVLVAVGGHLGIATGAGLNTNVALTPPTADAYNHRIQVFTQEGDYVTAWGRQGSAAGEFEVAIGVAVDGKGRLFVADQFNHRIQIFSAEGEFLGTWGKRGSGPGQFDRPSDVTFDEAGRIYVADFGNRRVQVFTIP